MIITSKADHLTIYSVEVRGVEYSAFINTLGRWIISSQRKSLKAARMGGKVRHFDSAVEVEQAIPAFAGLALLVQY